MNMETARTISALFDKYSSLKEARPSRKASEGKGTDERTLDCDFQPPNCLLFCDDNLWASRDARVTYHRLPFRSEETLPVLASQET